jgi:4a-hydroxytetrahydrobiopterin dehydratase
VSVVTATLSDMDEQGAKRITPRQFHEAAGVEDWRVVVSSGACAHFRTGSFAAGVALVAAIGRLAGAANHLPDVDLRAEGVTVRLTTHDFGGLSRRDVELARQISAAAHELNAPADPAVVQTVQVSIDALVGAEVMPVWRAVLGYGQVDEDLLDPYRRGPSFWFQQMDAPRPQRNRIHVDIFVPHDQAEARVAAAIAAGGRLVSDRHAPEWWALADAEGNEVDVATWIGRD